MEVLFLETGFLEVALAVLSSQSPACLCLLGDGITVWADMPSWG